MTSQQRSNRIALTSCDYFAGHELARNFLNIHRRELENCRVVCTGVHLDRMKDLERQGAELAQINPDDINQMEEVYRNCDWVVLRPMPEYNRVETTKRVMDAIKRANVKQVILLSNAAADSNEDSKYLHEFAEIEREFKNCGYNWNCILRTEFLQNWFHAWSYRVEDKGELALSTGQDRRFAPIRIEDISCAVKDIVRGNENNSTITKLLGGKKHNNQTYTLTGPECTTGPRIVEALNHAVQARVNFKDVDRNQMEQILRALRDDNLQKKKREGDEDHRRYFEGQPTDVQILTLLDYFDYVKAGRADRTTDDLRKITGRDGQRVESFFRDHASEFRPQRQ